MRCHRHKSELNQQFRDDGVVSSDLQNDRAVGSLILGPDGEIIQLSLFDSQEVLKDEQGTVDGSGC